jgi:hypothetical protein
METQKTSMVRSILRKKSITGGIIMPDLTVYYRAMAIKTVWHWHKNGHEEQWNRIKGPDINSHSFRYLIFDKEAQNILSREVTLFKK